MSASSAVACAAVLIIEDPGTPTDDTLTRLLDHPDCPVPVRWERVNTVPALREALRRRQDWKLVVSDARVRAVGALQAVALTRELAPSVPVVVLSQPEMTVANVVAAWITAAGQTSGGAHLAGDLEGGAVSPPVLEFARRLMETHEAERRHIARELHDELGQVLTAIGLNLAVAQRETGGAGSNAIAAAASLVGRALDQVRAFASELWPTVLDELGLPGALRWMIGNQMRAADLVFRIQVAPVPALPRALALTCFRVVQESLTNVARHASAHEVDIELRLESGALHLTVRDDGVGFDLNTVRQRAARGGTPTFGLMGMEERVLMMGGHFGIQSSPGAGTTVVATFPLGASDEAP